MKIKDKIQLTYDLPSGQELVLNFDTNKLINRNMYKSAKALHEIYERDYLFIPKKCDDVFAYLAHEYDADKVSQGQAAKQQLEHNVFDYVESMLDQVCFDCSHQQLIDFCRQVISDENQDYENDVVDSTFQMMLDSDNTDTHLKKMLIQLAIEFISEGSGMSSYVGGSFGKTQSDIFQIIIDEMGGGVFANKHSHLYEGAMSSVGLSDETTYYRDYFDISTYIVMNYVFYICQNKRFFFRFIGSLFRNESCFVNFQKQFSKIMKDHFGDGVDTRYFDVHAIVDQDHSIWSLDNIIEGCVKAFGPSVIPEIVRGFISYKLYQDINDIELCHGIHNFDQLNQMQNQSYQAQQLVTDINQGDRQYFIHDNDVVIETHGKAKLTLCYDLSEIELSESEKYLIPAYFPVWLDASSSVTKVTEIST